MRWVSNGDSPIYIWKDDEWYNQKDKTTYKPEFNRREWTANEKQSIPFSKKVKLF